MKKKGAMILAATAALILVIVSCNSYFKYGMYTSRQAEAKTVLKEIYAFEKDYKTAHGTYSPEPKFNPYYSDLYNYNIYFHDKNLWSRLIVACLLRSLLIYRLISMSGDGKPMLFPTSITTTIRIFG